MDPPRPDGRHGMSIYEALLIRRASVSDRRVALHHSVQFSILSSGLPFPGGYGLRVGLAREQLYLPPRVGWTGNHHPASAIDLKGAQNMAVRLWAY